MAGPLLLALLSAMLSIASSSAAASRAPPPPPLCPTQPSPDAPKYVEQINLTKCAHGCAELPQCASVTQGGVCIQQCAFPQFPADTGRRLIAWVGGDVDNQARPHVYPFASRSTLVNAPGQSRVALSLR